MPDFVRNHILLAARHLLVAIASHNRCTPQTQACGLQFEINVWEVIDSDGVPCRLGSWVPADKVKEEPPVDEDMLDAPPEVKPVVKPHKPQEAPESLVREKTVGVGTCLHASAHHSGNAHVKQPGP